MNSHQWTEPERRMLDHRPVNLCGCVSREVPPFKTRWNEEIHTEIKRWSTLNIVQPPLCKNRHVPKCINVINVKIWNWLHPKNKGPLVLLCDSDGLFYFPNKQADVSLLNTLFSLQDEKFTSLSLPGFFSRAPCASEARHFNSPNSHRTHLHVLFTAKCHFHFKPDLPICLCNAMPFAWDSFFYMQNTAPKRPGLFSLNLIWCFSEEKGLRGTTVPLVLSALTWRPGDKCF